MKKHFYLALLLLMAIGLGLLGCSEEDFFEKNGPQEINGIISQFSPETFSKVVSSDYKVNWDVSTPLEHSEELGADYYEFEISLLENQIQITSKLYDIKQSLLAVKKENGQYDFYVAKYFMDRWKSGGKPVKDVSFSKMESFSGLLNVFDNNSQMIHAKRMDNGRVLGTPLSLNSDFSNINIETRMEVDCEEVAIYHYIDRYHIEQGIPVRKYSDLVGISYERTCSVNYYPELNLEGGVPGTYYSQNGGGSYAGCNDPYGCVYKVETKLIRIEEQIDDSLLKPCMQSIVSDIKSLQNGMSWMIQKFSGDTSGFNWTMEDQSLPQGTGSTSSLYNRSTGTVTSKFDTQSYLNATELSWARTVLHESVHAYFVAYYSTNRPGFMGTYSQMVQDWNTYQTWEPVHHEEFARSLVKEVAKALEEFGNLRGYSYNKQFYEDMSWAGLEGTNTFQNGLSNSDKQRISNVIQIELTGRDLNGNSQNQKGNNAGC